MLCLLLKTEHFVLVFRNNKEWLKRLIQQLYVSTKCPRRVGSGRLFEHISPSHLYCLSTLFHLHLFICQHRSKQKKTLPNDKLVRQCMESHGFETLNRGHFLFILEIIKK
jgi:hypothetical protein